MPGLRRPVFPLAVVLLSVCAPAADAPVVPYTVCEILHNPAIYEGKAMAIGFNPQYLIEMLRSPVLARPRKRRKRRL